MSIRKIAKHLGWAMLVLLTLELVARATRATDVPLYRADNHIGYIPAPNQHGAFLWTHVWAFNALSMGTAAPFRGGVSGSVALIGDSIVLGGNPYRAAERLGPQLAGFTGRTVWPIGAGSWGLQNELQYMEDHPEVVTGVHQVVIVSNSGDFGAPSSWASELSHPRHRPWSAALQLARKYLWPSVPQVAADLKVTPKPLGPMVAGLITRLHADLIVILYPNRAELKNELPCGFPIPPMLRARNVRLLCVKSAPEWKAKLYRDDIHPSSDGMAVLARLIATTIDHPMTTPHSTAL